MNLHIGRDIASTSVGVIVVMVVAVIVTVIGGLPLLMSMFVVVIVLMLVFVVLVNIDKSGSLYFWRAAGARFTLARRTPDKACGFALIITFRIELWLNRNAVYAVLVHFLTDSSSDDHIVHAWADHDVHGRHYSRFGQLPDVQFVN